MQDFWRAAYAVGPVDEPCDTLVGFAVDGKTVRGSRTDDTAVHLFADPETLEPLEPLETLETLEPLNP